MSTCVAVSNLPIDIDHMVHSRVHRRSQGEALSCYSYECGQRERTPVLQKNQWRIFIGRFKKREFVD